MAKHLHTGKGRADGGALALRLFDQLFPAPSWLAWRAWTCATFGLAMTAAEADIFRRCTGRTTLPTAPAREVWTIVGRKAGKSRLAAFAAAYIATCRKFHIAPGERINIPIISPSRGQGQIVLDFAVAMLETMPGNVIARRTSEMAELTNGTRIQIQSASYRTPRGFTNGACIDEEVAFWRDDTGANPDVEILRMQRPSLATTHGPIIAISSPYAQRGELHRMYERHFGRDGSDVLVWQAATRDMNPTVSQGVIDQELANDPANAAAEWMGQFRADLETLFGRDALNAVVVSGRRELLPAAGVAYTGFVDPSGGSADSMTVAISHRNPAGVPVLDLVRERIPPFSPEAVVAEFVRDLKRYNILKVVGDKYAGEWPREQFRKLGVEYEVSELDRSAIFLECLPMVNSGAVELLDQPRLIGQLGSLQRFVGRTGKDAIDHRRGDHDDVANAAAGALVYAVRGLGALTLPTNFDRCNRAISIQGFHAASCFLFGGTNVPPADACCRDCPGRRWAVAARDAYTQRTGEKLDLRTFVREHVDIASHPFVEKVRNAAWWSRDHGL